MAGPDRLSLLAQIVALLLVVVVALDLVEAIGAQACSAPEAGHDCYPWGAEGPAADRWSYETKGHYLVSSAVALALSLCTAIAPLLIKDLIIRWATISAFLALVFGRDVVLGAFL